MNNLYYENILTHKISLSSNMLSKNLDYYILDILKEKIGNKCINEGYVDKDSIEIIKRSIGKLDSNNINGNIDFIVNFKANICNPLLNNIIDCVVDDNNKIGIIALNKPLDIVLSKRHHQNKEPFKILKKNDRILVKVIDKTFNLYDNSIIVLGEFVKKI